MKDDQILGYALKSLHQRKVRSWLTVIGIVIGIAAVITLLTIGQGFNDEIAKQLGNLGSNSIFVSPISESQANNAAFSSPATSPSSGKLFRKDSERLKKIPELEEITDIVTGRGTISFKEKSITAFVQGIEPGIFEKTSIVEIENGRFLTDSDKRVAVIGANIATDSFGNDKVSVNSFLSINQKKFRVIGILKKSAGGFGPSAQLDNAIMVPFGDAGELFEANLAENEVSAIVATIKDGSDVDEVTEKIEYEIAASHKVRPDEKDFSVISPKTIQERIGSIIGLLTAFLGAIASISLIVGGVGIANTMFMSIIERTHEIGVLKSIGATREDILKIFIFESGIIGGIGGLIGILLGMGAVFVAGALGAPVSVKIEILLFGFLFSVIVGLMAGVIPARQAASLSAVDALRYE